MSARVFFQKLYKNLKTHLKEVDDRFVSFEPPFEIEILDRKGEKEQIHRINLTPNNLLKLEWLGGHTYNRIIEFSLKSETLLKDIVDILEKRHTNIKPKAMGPVTIEKIEPLIKKYLKNYADIKKVGFTGSLARKGKGNDIDLVIQYRDSELNLAKIEKRIFLFGLGLWRLLDQEIKLDIFLKVNFKWFTSSKLKNTNLNFVTEQFDVPKDKIKDLKYLITSMQRAGFPNGYWFKEVPFKEIKAAKQEESATETTSYFNYYYYNPAYPGDYETPTGLGASFKGKTLLVLLKRKDKVLAAKVAKLVKKLSKRI